MTAQFSEILIYQGKELTLCTEPLGPFLEFSANPLRFQYNSRWFWVSLIKADKRPTSPASSLAFNP